MFVGTVETTLLDQMSHLSSQASCLQERLTVYVAEDTCVVLIC